jgi:hypothetical protein
MASNFLRVVACSCRAFDRISFNVICDVSVGWDFQIVLRSSLGISSGMILPFAELLRQKILDSVNPYGYIPW